MGSLRGAHGSCPDLVVEDRFATVPDWLLDADIGDAAVRLYAVPSATATPPGALMPSPPSTLARRLRERSTDSVDRAITQLIGIDAVRVEHRYDGTQRLTNAYHVHTSRPTPSESPTPPNAGSRKKIKARRELERQGMPVTRAGVIRGAFRLLTAGLGWGELTLIGSHQTSGRAWTDAGTAGEERGLKHRSSQETRQVPAHPELVAILRRYLDESFSADRVGVCS